MPFFRHLYIRSNYEQEILDAYANFRNNNIELWECRICHCMIDHKEKTKHLESQQHLALDKNLDCPKMRNCELWTCEACNIEIQLCNKDDHFKCYAHILNTSEDEEEAIARFNNPDLNYLCEEDFWKIHNYYKEDYLRSLYENGEKEIKNSI